MDWLIEQTRQKLIEGWNEIVEFIPRFRDCIIEITKSIIELLKK